MFTEDGLKELQANQRRANPHPADCRCVLCEEEHREAQRRSHAALRNANALEKQLEQDCTNILIQDGWRALKTDPVSRKAWGKGFGEPGMADYLYLRYDGMDNVLAISDPTMNCTEVCVQSLCQVLWVEYKREKGGIVADHQREWHRAERAKGALVLVAGEDFPATVEGFVDYYQRCGLMRNKR